MARLICPAAVAFVAAFAAALAYPAGAAAFFSPWCRHARHRCIDVPLAPAFGVWLHVLVLSFAAKGLEQDVGVGKLDWDVQHVMVLRNENLIINVIIQVLVCM